MVKRLARKSNTIPSLQLIIPPAAAAAAAPSTPASLTSSTSNASSPVPRKPVFIGKVTPELCEFLAALILRTWRGGGFQLSDLEAQTGEGAALNCHASYHHLRTFAPFVYHVLKTTSISLSVVLLAVRFMHLLRLRQTRDGHWSKGYWNDSLSTMKGLFSDEKMVFVACLIIAMKSPNGCCNTFTNKTWSKVSNLPMADLNKLELEICLRLSFDLWAQESDYLVWLFSVEAAISEFKIAIASSSLVPPSIYRPLSPLPGAGSPLVSFVSPPKPTHSPQTCITWKTRPTDVSVNNINLQDASLRPPQTPVSPAALSSEVTSTSFSAAPRHTQGSSRNRLGRRFSVPPYQPYIPIKSLSVPSVSSSSTILPSQALSRSASSATFEGRSRLSLYPDAQHSSSITPGPMAGRHPPLVPLSFVRASHSNRSMRPHSVSRIVTSGAPMLDHCEGYAPPVYVSKQDMPMSSYTIANLLKPKHTFSPSIPAAANNPCILSSRLSVSHNIPTGGASSFTYPLPLTASPSCYCSSCVYLWPKHHYT